MRARTEYVLNELIGEYIRTAQPVASQVLSQKTNLQVSPATMRNEMAFLEEAGYITRPHISAGAMPTDKGYRFYVQRLCEDIQPDQGMADQVRERFQRSRTPEDWVEMAARLLAEIVDSVAMVTFPTTTRSRVKRIELVQLQEFMALLIVVLQGARLLQQMMPMSQPVSQDELNVVGNKLSYLFGGMDRTQIKKRRVQLSALEDRAREGTIAAMQEADEEAFDPHVDGLRRLMRQPELSEETRIAPLVDLLEERVVLRRLLARVAEQGRPQVLIGTENTEEVLWPYSLVLCPYGISGEITGIVGVLGPTRLPYHVAFEGVNTVSGVMTDMVCTIHRGEN